MSWQGRDVINPYRILLLYDNIKIKTSLYSSTSTHQKPTFSCQPKNDSKFSEALICLCGTLYLNSHSLIIFSFCSSAMFSPEKVNPSSLLRQVLYSVDYPRSSFLYLFLVKLSCSDNAKQYFRQFHMRFVHIWSPFESFCMYGKIALAENTRFM